MRDPARITRITRKLEVLWLTVPDLRFGQLVSFVDRTLPLGEISPDENWYVEDETWEAWLDELLGSLGTVTPE